MICGEPNPTSSGWNELFAHPLIEYRKRGKSFTEGENRREVKCQVRVVLRLVVLVLFIVKKKRTCRRRYQKRKEKEAKKASEPRNPMTVETAL